MIPLPKKPKVIEKKGNFAVIEMESLYPGYGITIGNALRRVLLSSLEGVAITTIKIKGVSHEFSTLPWVMEDVVEIILNLKQVRFEYFTQDFPQKAELKIKGEKEVKAGDIKVPATLKVANPEHHIATLTDKRGEISMEIWIEKGVGYEPVEQRQKEKLEIGTIALDAIFTPIKKVNFRVENMRVGERTDFNRLFLEIETDGTIAPEEAFLKASEILVNHYQLMLELPFELKRKKVLEEVKEEDILKLKIEELKLSTRVINALLYGEIKTLADLLKKTEKDLKNLDGFGENCLKEVKRFLKKKGLSLKK